MASAIVVGSRGDQERYGEQGYRREIGRRIREERSWLNLRQEELAVRAGVSRHFVGAIERGRHGLDAWRLRRVAGALGRDICWLLADPAEPRSAGTTRAVDQEMPQ
ncbi:MAG TPA: helix-turn-helix transcriptional regulator [Actinoplanes sp.]|nr:helix-turn-helix transcriptional regulator [Actinoplanes sp.]